MNDFRSWDYRQMHFPALRETVQHYKENPEEVSNMCREIEDWLKEEHAEGRVEGRAEGRTEGENNTIFAMLKHGMPAETIAQAIGWTNEKVRELGRLNRVL
jgi:predicted transposase YdaD